MAVEIVLTTTPEGNVLASHADRPLSLPTPLAALPRITADSNPYGMGPVELGQRLYPALGGAALTALLDADDERLLYLAADEAAAGVPWEYAARPDGSFLACDTGFLRLVPDIRPARPAAAAPLNFISGAKRALSLSKGMSHAASTGSACVPAQELTALRELLARHFNLEELRTLCADLGVDYDDLPGEGKTARARELIAYLDRRGRLPQLIRVGAAARGDVPWDAAGIAAATATDAPANAARLHRLVASLARGGLPLLLTSRQQPAGLDGEIVFPAGGALDGVMLAAGTALFFHHSSRAKSHPEAHAEFARGIARATAGHPLAIALLAGEFDVSTEVAPAAFLAGWDRELAAARREGLAEHHVTFAIAFNRNYRLLPPADRARLAALSRYNLPFFAEGAAFLWDGVAPETEAARAATRAALEDFVWRSLLRVGTTFTDTDRAATYRLEPVIQRQLAAELPPDDREGLAPSYAAYARWLVNQAYGKTGSDPGTASLIQAWADELMGQATAQPDGGRAGYC